MSNLIRRQDRHVARGDEQATALDPLRSWDPFRMMDALLRWDPLGATARSGWHGMSFMPTFDVKETKDGYLLTADLPGVKEADLDLTVTGNVLTIAGHREDERQEEDERYVASERSFGHFSRSFTVPEGADLSNIKADLRNGVLSVHLAKKPEVQPRKIQIGTSNPINA